MLTAQRMSMLHEFDAPEFSDRTLFKLFIESLQDTGILARTDDGRLTRATGLTTAVRTTGASPRARSRAFGSSRRGVSCGSTTRSGSVGAGETETPSTSSRPA